MLTIREFQRNFCTLKGQIQEVFDSEGKKIGTWFPENGSINSVGQQLASTPSEIAGKKVFNGLLDTVGQTLSPPMLNTDAKMAEDGLYNSVGHGCEKCLIGKTECYKVWEDGEERIVCADCLKKVIPAKRFKSYVSRLEKAI